MSDIIATNEASGTLMTNGLLTIKPVFNEDINNINIVYNDQVMGDYSASTLLDNYQVSTLLDNYHEDTYINIEKFSFDVISDTLIDGFTLSDGCFVDVIKKIYENESFRENIFKKMPVIVMKSNDVFAKVIYDIYRGFLNNDK